MICNICGAQIPDGYNVCPSCGNAVGVQQAYANPYATYVAPKPKKKKGPIIIAIVLVVALLIGTFAFLIPFFKSRGPLTTIMKAVMNTLEDGFNYTVSFSEDGEVFSANGAVMPVDLDSEELEYEGYFKIDDEVYYLDNQYIWESYGDRGCLENYMYESPIPENETDAQRARREFNKLMQEMVISDAKGMIDDFDFGLVADYLNFILSQEMGHKVIDEKGFEKCAKSLLGKINSKSYLEDNFGYTEKDKKNGTAIIFEFDVKDLLELCCDELEECEDAFIYEADFEMLLEELEEEIEYFDEKMTIEAEIIIDGKRIVEASVEYTEVYNSGNVYSISASVEIEDLGDAEIPSEVISGVSAAKEMIGDLERIIYWDNDGYYYYNDNNEKIYRRK